MNNGNVLIIQNIINWVQGDLYTNIDFVLQDYNGNVVNLTGFALTFNAQADGISGLNFTGSMVIDGATLGQCHYTPTAGNFSVTGNYLCQIVAVNSSSGQKETWNGIQAIVWPRLPAY